MASTGESQLKKRLLTPVSSVGLGGGSCVSYGPGEDIRRRSAEQLWVYCHHLLRLDLSALFVTALRSAFPTLLQVQGFRECEPSLILFRR